MSKEKLKNNALKVIDRLENGISIDKSETTCNIMFDKRYEEFLVNEKILKSTRYSVMNMYFTDCINWNKSANTFRMMMIIEFCKQNGIEL